MTEKMLIGIDIGGTTTKIALLTNDGAMIEKCAIRTPNKDSGFFLSVTVPEAVKNLCGHHQMTKEHVAGIGVGAPGPVHQETGMFYEITNLDWPDHYPVKEILEKSIGLPVRINNDANCAALGEMWKGAGMGARDLLCITIGTGIGGGVIVHGSIVHGIRGAAGEIGHITSVLTNGAPCNCGKKGCLETVSSATGIVRLAEERIHQDRDPGKRLTSLLAENGSLTAKDVFSLAGIGDETALDVVNEAARYLGIALANIANTLNPEIIIVGGGVSKAGDVLLHPVKSTFAKYIFPASAGATEIKLAALGNDAGVIGAAWMVRTK
ncbi:ROK family glucokinase [Bacillus benzoevorans]|uniref:Glucokinase n=1 Tax=Bacillus benzoevorans TaxID=1456 RepID=A0A7X0HS77_9BACI|nr:ROK family glucokinase [Bacillus benzoevorans]MBB6444917.1 glucokinase [Bacillus benzoevorans]